MSKFQKHLGLVIKHWPKQGDENTPVIRKFAEISALAGLEEQDISEFCEMISDMNDDSFTNGINAANSSYQ